VRRREVITFIGDAGSKRPVKLVTAAILCFAGVYAEATEICVLWRSMDHEHSKSRATKAA